jgi:hypothetical protein
MPVLANVALTDTFDTWRIRTNQIIVSLNTVDANSSNAYAVSIAGITTANLGYQQANVGTNIAIASFNATNSNYGLSNTTSNTLNTVYGIANVAYGKANAANVLAYTSGIIASAGYDQANTAYAQANLVYGQANTAYDQANTGYNQANLVFGRVNSAYGQANTVYTVSNNAFNKANSANFYAYQVDSNTQAAFAKANNALANTNGVVFNGSLFITANLGIGLTSAPAANLHVVGSMVATGDITSAYSDERLKEVIEPLQNAVSKIVTLDTFFYKPNQTALDLGLQDERQIGVSAQQVQKVLPEIVKDAPIGQGYLTVQYERVVPLLIEAIKELTDRIEKIENGIKNRKCNCRK